MPTFLDHYNQLSAKAKLSLLDTIYEETNQKVNLSDFSKAEDFSIKSIDGNTKLNISFSDDGNVLIGKSHALGFDANLNAGAKMKLPGMETSSDMQLDHIESKPTGFDLSASASANAELGSAKISYTVIDDESGSAFEIGGYASAAKASASAKIGFDAIKKEGSFDTMSDAVKGEIDAKFAEIGVEAKYKSPMNVEYDPSNSGYKVSQVEIGGDYGFGAGLEAQLLGEKELFKMGAKFGMGGGISLGYDNDFDDDLLSDFDKRLLLTEAVEDRITYNNGRMYLGKDGVRVNEQAQAENIELEKRLENLNAENYTDALFETDQYMQSVGMPGMMQFSERENYVEKSDILGPIGADTDISETIEDIEEITLAVDNLNLKIEDFALAVSKI